MSDRRGPDNLLQWLLAAGDEALSNPRFSDALSGAVKRAASTKGQVDKNMEILLQALNIPTRSDLARLTTKVEALQGSLVNISMKLDRLLAEQESRKKPPKRTSPTRRTSASKVTKTAR